MKAWDDIVTAALVGTERGAFAAPAWCGEPGRALAALKAETPEAQLLGCAALVGTCGRAGYRPPRRAEAPALSEETLHAAGGGTLPRGEGDGCADGGGGRGRPRSQEISGGEDGGTVCSARAERLLLSLLEPAEETLGAWREELLREWLTLAAGAGRTLPAAALPVLLEAGRKDRGLRELIGPVLGRRGAWLAGLNADWGYALEKEGEESAAAWEEGAQAERKAWLARLREQDPAAARQRLAAVWGAEPAAARAAFLGVLERGLSLEDEAFLESALDDRSKEVRYIALELLARLPESAFVGRMRGRVGPFVELKRGLLGGLKIEVQLPPAEPEADWRRDGLVPERSANEAGVRSQLLKDILAAIPLEHWTAGSGATAEELIKKAGQTEWATPLIWGFALAARRQRAADWIIAILENVKPRGLEYDPDRMYEALAPEALLAYLERLFQHKGESLKVSIACNILISMKRPLTPDLTRDFLAVLRATFKAKKNYEAFVAQVLLALGRRGAPGLYPEAEAMAREATATETEWTKTLEKFLTLYEFRYAMQKELTR